MPTTDGPVLTPTDLYLLQTELELHPILMGVSNPSFVFNLSTGASAMFNSTDRERDLPFTKASYAQLCLVPNHLNFRHNRNANLQHYHG